MNIYQYRGALKNTKEAIKNGSLTVGFLGGSISAGYLGNNWTEPVCSWLGETYPQVRINVENAAIGATGSGLAAFRAESEIIARGCNLVFVEYAVNDLDLTTEMRNRTREGLLRKLLASGSIDVVLVYTFSQPMYQNMAENIVPDTIAEFEVLAQYYNLSSVWMGLYAFEEIQKGRMTWEQWLPDGLHPQTRGSLSYAQSVMELLKNELSGSVKTTPIKSGTVLPKPLNDKNWQHTQWLPFSEVTLKGPWKEVRWRNIDVSGRVLVTSAVGAEMSFSFEGRGLCLGFDFGKTASEFVYQIDGGQWVAMKRARPDWCGNTGWFKLETLTDELQNGKHTCRIRVTHGDTDDCKGTNFYLALIGIIKA